MTLRFGKYEVVDKIGEGGFGEVFKGRDSVLKRFVAIKTCKSTDRELRQRFVREAEISALLQHPNITTVFDFGEENGTPYLVQEFLEGADLSTLLRRGEPRSRLARLELLLQVATGLAHAHASQVVHRDLKPQNLRVLDDGRVKIMDFGIAKLLVAESQLTQAGMTMGTAGYLPPEQLLGQDVDHRADIFSFGVLTYELMAGRRPFEGESVTTVFYRIAHENPAPVRDSWPDCPAALERLVARCLEKDRERRYASVGELIAELEALAATWRREEARPAAAAAAAAAVAPFPIDLDRSLPPPPFGGGAVAPSPVRAPVRAEIPLDLAASLPPPPGSGGRKATEPLPGVDPGSRRTDRDRPRQPTEPYRGVHHQALPTLGQLPGPPPPPSFFDTFSRALGGRRGAIAALVVAAALGGWWVATESVDSPQPEAGSPPPPPAEPTEQPPPELPEPVKGPPKPPEPPPAKPALPSPVTPPPTPPPPTPPPVEERPGQATHPLTEPVVVVAGDGAATVATVVLEKVPKVRVVTDGALPAGAGVASLLAGDAAALALAARHLGASRLVVARLSSESGASVGRFFTGRAALELRLVDGATGQPLGGASFQVGSQGTPGVLEPSAEAARSSAIRVVAEKAAARIAEWLG